MDYDYDFITIGSGPAAQRAAVQAAKTGRRVAVVERTRVVGGVCVTTGTVPSKTFREAVLSVSAQTPGEDWEDGFPPMDLLRSRVESVLEREVKVIEHQLQRNGIRLIHGQASFVDAHTLRVVDEEGEQTVTADKILIACGSRSTEPKEVECDGRLVVTSDDILCIPSVPRTMVVVGAGVIGIEYASMFAALGTEVVVVDGRQRPLEFLDREIVDQLVHELRNRDVVFRFEETVAKVSKRDGDPPKGVVELASGKRFIADLVLFSIGRRGATDGLDLEAAGLAPDDRGRVSVDECYRTEVKNILAAGDVIGFPSLAATSSRQGRLAACHAFGHDVSTEMTNFPFGIYSIPELSMVGSTEKALTDEKVPYEFGVARYRETVRGHILGDDDGLLKILIHRETEELLGVHIIGTQATELIHIGQAVIRLGGGLDYFLDTVFNYPTLAECYKIAALDVFNKLNEDLAE
ncbi:MAG: Si-specific NAD(P)(+) transhydrogenase [Planctomycetota bacterium]